MKTKIFVVTFFYNNDEERIAVGAVNQEEAIEAAHQYRRFPRKSVEDVNVTIDEPETLEEFAKGHMGAVGVGKISPGPFHYPIYALVSYKNDKEIYLASTDKSYLKGYRDALDKSDINTHLFKLVIERD